MLPTPKRILVLRLGAVGEIVRTLPAVEFLRRAFPGAELAWGIETHVAPLLEGHPSIDRRIIYDRNALKQDWRRGRCLRAWMRGRGFVNETREFAPDLAIDFQGCFKSGWAAWLSRAPHRIGFDKPWVREGAQRFATERVELRPEHRHRVLRAMALALETARRFGGVEDALDADPREVLPSFVGLGLTESELEEGRVHHESLAAGRRSVALAPFCSGGRPWKRYPLEHWRAVARGLVEDGTAVLFVVGPGEEEEAHGLVAELGPLAQMIVDRSLRQAAAVLAHCDAFAGVDTGPMHLAWAAGTSVVSVFGPTDPGLHAPLGEGHDVLAPERLTGRKDPDRFPGITPERLLATLRERLDRVSPAGGDRVLPATPPASVPASQPASQPASHSASRSRANPGAHRDSDRAASSTDPAPDGSFVRTRR